MEIANQPVVLALAVAALAGVVLLTLLRSRKPGWVRPLSGVAYVLVVFPVLLAVFGNGSWALAALSAAIGALLWWRDPWGCRSAT